MENTFNPQTPPPRPSRSNLVTTSSPSLSVGAGAVSLALVGKSLSLLQIPIQRGRSITVDQENTAKLHSLLEWCKSVVAPYSFLLKHPITDFTERTWGDGLAFCVLFLSRRPDAIAPYLNSSGTITKQHLDYLQNNPKERNFQIAFEIGRTLGIPDGILDEREMISLPNPNTIVTYIIQCYNIFQSQTENIIRRKFSVNTISNDKKDTKSEWVKKLREAQERRELQKESYENSFGSPQKSFVNKYNASSSKSLESDSPIYQPIPSREGQEPEPTNPKSDVTYLQQQAEMKSKRNTFQLMRETILEELEKQPESHYQPVEGPNTSSTSTPLVPIETPILRVQIPPSTDNTMTSQENRSIVINNNNSSSSSKRENREWRQTFIMNRESMAKKKHELDELLMQDMLDIAQDILEDPNGSIRNRSWQSASKSQQEIVQQPVFSTTRRKMLSVRPSYAFYLARCLSDFIPEEENQLGFKKNEVLEIFEQDQSGWWLARKDGVCGWIPSDFVILLEKEIENNNTQENTSAQPSEQAQVNLSQVFQAIDQEEEDRGEFDYAVFEKQRTLKEGSLLRLGSGMVKMWSKRWFILKGTKLWCFKDKPNPNSHPINFIQIESAKEMEPVTTDSKKTNKAIFKIVTPEKTHFLQANNLDEMIDWIIVLKDAQANKDRNRLDTTMQSSGLISQGKQGTLEVYLSNKWRKQWFQVKDAILSHYDSKNGKLVNKIPLYGCSFEKYSTNDKKLKHCFQLLPTNQQNVILLKADSESELTDWLSTLQFQKTCIQQSINSVNAPSR